MVGGKLLATGWAHAPTSGMQSLQMGFNSLSHTMPPLGITVEQLGAWVAISQLPHRPGNNPFQDEAFAEVLCAYLSPGTGTRPFGMQVEVPRAATAPQALPSRFAIALGLCHVPSLFTRVCMGTRAHTCPFCAAPLCLCAMIKGGSARQGLKQRDGHHEPEHGGE